MRFYNFTIDDIYRALAEVNKRYDGNVGFEHKQSFVPKTSRGTPSVDGTLSVANTKLPPALHIKPTGQRSRSVTWRGHWYFMFELFTINPTGRIKTRDADYRNYVDFIGQTEAAGKELVRVAMAHPAPAVLDPKDHTAHVYAQKWCRREDT